MSILVYLFFASLVLESNPSGWPLDWHPLSSSALTGFWSLTHSLTMSGVSQSLREPSPTSVLLSATKHGARPANDLFFLSSALTWPTLQETKVKSS